MQPDNALLTHSPSSALHRLDIFTPSTESSTLHTVRHSLSQQARCRLQIPNHGAHQLITACLFPSPLSPSHSLILNPSRPSTLSFTLKILSSSSHASSLYRILSRLCLPPTSPFIRYP